MLLIALKGNTANLLDERLSEKMKKIALRFCDWPSVLQRTNKGLNNLTVKSEENHRSATAANSLLIIAEKFEEDVTSGISRTLRGTPFFFARRFSLLAHRSSISAKKRASDLSLLRFLTVNNINNPRYSKHNKFHLRMCLQ